MGTLLELTGTYGHLDTSPATGYVDIVPAITAPLLATIIVQEPVRATLDAEGKIAVEIYASDDADWATAGPVPYIFREFVNGQVAQWMAYVEGPGPVDIKDLVPVVEAPPMGSYLTQAQGDARYVNMTGDTMSAPLLWKGPSGGEGGIGMVADVGGEALEIVTAEGLLARAPYIVLDSQSLHLTLSGGQLNSPLVVVGFDQLGGAILGWGAPLSSAWEVDDSTETPVTIKAANSSVPSAWVRLGLTVTVPEVLTPGKASVSLVMPVYNASTRTGEVELGITVDGGAPVSSGHRVSISAGQDSTIALNTVNVASYAQGAVIEFFARVVTASNTQFSLVMDAAPGNAAVVRVVGN